MTIPQEQLHSRWDELPEELQDEIMSEANDEMLDNLTQSLGLPLAQHKKVAYVCLLVFSGFMRIKDVYEELCSSVGLDARSALQIYQALDQNMFSRRHAAIEANYQHFQQAQSSAPAEADIVEGPALSEQVVIKDSKAADVVDLKAMKKPAPEPEKAHPLLQGDAPLIINFSAEPQQPPQAPAAPSSPFEAQHPFNPSISYGVPAAFEQAPAGAPQRPPLVVARKPFSPAPAAPFPQPAPEQPAAHPFMLHQQQETAPVAQASQAYKSVSIGSFMGSFKGGFSKPAQQQASRASIEMPIADSFENRPARPHVLLQKQDPLSPSGPAVEHPEQEVSFSVKKYAETPKVVNYSDLKTPLDA
jgi:hypothetical protein